MLASPEILTAILPDGPAFLDAVRSYGLELGYRVSTEGEDLLLGDPEKALCLVAAVFTGNNAAGDVQVLLETICSLPECHRDKVCFLLLKKNMAQLRKLHPRLSGKTVLYLSGVGTGNQLEFIPGRKLKADPVRMNWLWKGCGYFGPKTLLIREKDKGIGMAEFRRFPFGVGITGKKEKDTPKGIDITNINLLRASLSTLIGSAVL